MEKDRIQNQVADQEAENAVLPENSHKSDFGLLVQIRRHPFLFWVSLWTLLLVVISVTLTSFLLNPEFVVQDEQLQESPSAAVSPDAPAPVFAETGKESLPLWSFGAIAFSCAVASLMVSQRLRQPPRPRKPTKRSSFVSPRTQAAIAPIPRPAASVNQSALQLTEPEESAVSVVPTEENHPLDWGEASLADSLDIRYRRPLSSWR